MYILYMTVNIKNKKFYVGVHKVRNQLEDGYLGSGKVLKRAILKYGREFFIRVDLRTFETKGEVLAAEKLIVDEVFLKSSLTYNLAKGGGCGSSDANGLSFKGRAHSLTTRNKIAAARKGVSTISPAGRQSLAESNKINFNRRNKISKTLTGRKLSENHRKNLAEAIRLWHKKAGGQKGVPKSKVTCPHCKIEGSPNNMKRWHFDNCKSCGA